MNEIKLKEIIVCLYENKIDYEDIVLICLQFYPTDIDVEYGCQDDNLREFLRLIHTSYNVGDFKHVINNLKK